MEHPKHHQLNFSLELTHIIEREVATVYFYKNIVVVEANEGVNISYKSAFSLLIRGLSILKNRPWVYISNRKNSYSVTPTDYKYLKRVPSLKAMAIVSNSQTGKVNAKIESTFFDRPFQIFDSINDAAQWALEILEN